MSAKAPDRLNLPNDFPAAIDVRSMGDAARDQRNWWYDAKRAIQDYCESLLKGKKKFDTSGGIGSGTPTLGTTAPITSTMTGSPYAWAEVIAPDGTTCVIPLWKKV